MSPHPLSAYSPPAACARLAATGYAEKASRIGRARSFRAIPSFLRSIVPFFCAALAATGYAKRPAASGERVRSRSVYGLPDSAWAPLFRFLRRARRNGLCRKASRIGRASSAPLCIWSTWLRLGSNVLCVAFLLPYVIRFASPVGFSLYSLGVRRLENTSLAATG